MRTQLILVAAICSLAFSDSVSTETFTSVDREVEGMMDAWVTLQRGAGTGLSGFFTAGTAVLRAEIAYGNALMCDPGNLPPDIAAGWTNYLKASADCIFSCRTALMNFDAPGSEEIILASFSRWETSGGEFLSSIQSTR